ncbi:hypothetical protein FDP41_008513 [Naegleria fowleri]|uniref:Uncharacterized protein n=1 Tax=Naegleria fowleri TaxID=5763 RepID=A0A6A5BFB8_NAEFO|nr:uncharacterized protein FDP41_008513 [Naegleria fowleri]KAF0973306.1 hypothetical protein FDP41_008513 [Naegleria fowleri]CAG4714870.1 unnamed protein product [Naegleria fowleri]
MEEIKLTSAADQNNHTSLSSPANPSNSQQPSSQEQPPERRSRNPFKRFKKKKKDEPTDQDEIKDEREPQIKGSDNLIIFKIFGWNWLLVLLGSIGSLGNGVIPLSFQFVMGDLLNIFQPKNGVIPTVQSMKDNIAIVATNFAIIAAAAAVASFLSQFFLNWASERMGVALRKAYFNALTSQEMGFFDIKKTGALTVALSEDISKIQEAYSNKLALFLQNFAQFVIGVVLAFVSSWQMSLVMISTSPLLVLGIGILSKLVEFLTKKTNKATEHSAALATEVVGAFRTVKSMGCETKEQERFAQDLKNIHLYGLIKASMQGTTFAAVSIILWGTVALSFWYGGGLVAEGTITVGDMMKVFGMMLFGVLGLSQAGTVLPDFSKAQMSQKTLLKVLKRQPAIPFRGGVIPEEPLKGNVQIRNVNFSYPSRPNVTVLKNFNMEIKPGTSVALVGPSGSGKSTFVGLLERFYDPQEGEIIIDGHKIKDIDPQWLHKNIGIVTQEPVLFSCTIRENIAYAAGLENVTQEQIENAAKAANCHNFIVEMPDGYNTKLGEKGISLSGGQKQRVAIARAVLQNPQILLLDEATSALDTESEALVQQALDNLMKGRSTICIAHRLSTVQNCDTIYVLVKGELKESGTHHELLKIENGVYKKLAEKQMLFGRSDSVEFDRVTTQEIISDETSSNVINE